MLPFAVFVGIRGAIYCDTNSRVSQVKYCDKIEIAIATFIFGLFYMALNGIVLTDRENIKNFIEQPQKQLSQTEEKFLQKIV
jgi:uncharacterized membrane protein (Fun14 family)